MRPLGTLIARATILIGLLLGGGAQAGDDWLDWLDRNLVKRIELSGYRRLAYHDHRVEGDLDAYGTLTYSGPGNKRFTDFGNIRAEGRKVLGLFNFSAQILDSRFTDPQQQKFTLDYQSKGWTVGAFDIQGSLPNTNRFATFSRSLRGVSVGYRAGRFEAKALRSESRGEARTVVLPGNNSSGPYYLQSSQIVADSEQVEIDGEPMRLGQDYVINYELGAITFIDRIVPPTSSIVVTYETLAFNAARGTIQGAGLSYNFGRAGRLGLTAMQQLPRGGTGLTQRLEKFQGFGAPGTPYVLQFEPLRSQPIVVRLDGVLQTEGVDYRFDPENPSIFYFNRFVPSTSTIDVLYTPRPLSTLDGEREVLGVDYRLPFGNRGHVGVALAKGVLKNEVTPLSGTARGADLRYGTGGWEFSAGLRDVPEGYVTVESRGLNRNERTAEWSILRRDGKGFEFGFGQSNSAIRTKTTAPDGSIGFRPSRFSRAQGYAQYQPADGWQWSARHERTRAGFGGQSTQISTSELGGGTTFGRGDIRLAYERQSGAARLLEGGNLRRRTLTRDGLRVSGGYRLGDRLTLRGNASVSAIEADGEKGSGKDVSLSAAYTASERLRLAASYELGDSGRLNTLGSFQSGFGLGFDGSGFNSGVPGTAVGATDYQRWGANAEFNPTDRVALNARVNRIRYAGSVSSNTETTSVGVGANFDFGPPLQVDLGLDQSRTKFIGSATSSSATVATLSLSGSPRGRFSYRAGASILATGGNSEFRQDSASYDLTLAYQLAPRHLLSFGLSAGDTRGYLPQGVLDASLTYQYQIWRSLALNVRCRVQDVRNRDPQNTSGAFRSRGFDVELAFNFGR